MTDLIKPDTREQIANSAADAVEAIDQAAKQAGVTIFQTGADKLSMALNFVQKTLEEVQEQTDEAIDGVQEIIGDGFDAAENFIDMIEKRVDEYRNSTESNTE